MQSLGILLTAAADNKDMDLSLKEIGNVSWLLQVLDEVLNGCYAVHTEVSKELIKRKIK